MGRNSGASVLGLELAKKRKDQGLSRVDLAGKLNVSVQAVRMWERGEANPNRSNQKRIREWLRDEPRTVDWGSLQPCVKRCNDLWQSRRVELKIDGFAESHMTVETTGEYDLLKEIIEAAKKNDQQR